MEYFSKNKSYMFEVLQAYFEQRMTLTPEQVNSMQRLFIPRHLKKAELLIREGEIAKYGAFVAKGCLRSYVVDNKGKEHIVQFAPENWWLADVYSMVNNLPSLYFMDALEPSDILLLDLLSHEKLMNSIPGFAGSFQAGMQKH